MKSPVSDFVFFQIQRGDFVFLAVLYSSIFVFVALESIWLVRQFKKPVRRQVDLVWSVIPALVLFFLTLAYRTPTPQAQSTEKVVELEIKK